MTVRAYYSEWDPYAAQWLRNLMAAGLIMDGVVDDRSIAEVTAKDLVGFARVHLFSGISGWDYALQLAGWSSDREVWTGSCPCQPFSCAGKRKGASDSRHLWPEMFRLVRGRRPPVIFGEQVASKDGLRWLDGVFADLESAGYTCGAADLCAAGIRAPHIRQRLFWVAESQCWTPELRRHDLGATEGETESRAQERERVRVDAGTGRNINGLGDPDRPRHPQFAGEPQWASETGGMVQPNGTGSQPGRIATETDGYRDSVEPTSCTGGMADAALGQSNQQDGYNHERGRNEDSEQVGMGNINGPWDAYELVPRRDGKCCRIEPGTFPLAHGLPRKVGLVQSWLQGVAALAANRLTLGLAKKNRVGRLKGYGNAIVPELAAEFIRAYMELRP